MRRFFRGARGRAAALASIAVCAFALAPGERTGAAAEAWTPPIGIPMPPFGIVEAAGRATHYVDNTQPAATDTDNPNGSPARPRQTIPAELPAGSVVEVRGGPYAEARRTTWEAAGTAERPVFIRGVGAPEFRTAERRILGTYLVVEGLTFANSPLRFRGDHLALRGCEVRDFSPGTHSAAISGLATDVVISGNHIHHNGDVDSPREVDVHGIKFGTGSARLWIVDNRMHHNGGDAVQMGGSPSEPWPSHLYIGRNLFHEDRENAVDIKQARDVILSQNEAWGYHAVSSSDGTAIVVHDNPDRVWVLFNHIHSAVNGVRNNGSSASYIVGNVIRNVHHDARQADYDPANPWATGAAVISWRTGDLFVVNNTFHDVDAGVSYPDKAGRVHLANNIVTRVAPPRCHVGVPKEAVADGSTLGHSLLQAPARVLWGGEVYDLKSLRRRFPAQGQGCIDGDPLFVSAEDLRLRPGSPAIDAGVADPVYETFRQQYGLDIAKDHAGQPRPQGRGWDLGAFER